MLFHKVRDNFILPGRACPIHASAENIDRAPDPIAERALVERLPARVRSGPTKQKQVRSEKLSRQVEPRSLGSLGSIV
jgi:hypothetical protein